MCSGGSGLYTIKLEGFSVADHIKIRAQEEIGFAFAYSSTSYSWGHSKKGAHLLANGSLLFPGSLKSFCENNIS